MVRNFFNVKCEIKQGQPTDPYTNLRIVRSNIIPNNKFVAKENSEVHIIVVEQAQ